MQRNGFVGLLFALTLAIQAALPGVSAFAHPARDTLDPAFGSCWNAKATGAAQKDQGSGQSERRHFGCLFCEASSAGATPFVAATLSTSAFVSTFYQLRRFAADAAPPRSYDVSARQARAPPRLS